MLLNKSHENPGFEVTVVFPSGEGKTIGPGVKQSVRGVKFKVIYAEEVKAWYGKPFFKDFKKILVSEKPDIVITIWPFILGFVLYPSLFFKLRRRSFKLIMKDIPLQVPELHDVFRYYKTHPVYDEFLNKERNSGPGFYLKTVMITFLRFLYYNIIDGAVNYTEEGKEIISSYGLSRERIFTTYNSPDTDPLFKAKEEIKNEPEIMQLQPTPVNTCGQVSSLEKN